MKLELLKKIIFASVIGLLIFLAMPTLSARANVLFSDNFNRTDENPIASPWITRGSGGSVFQISSNHVTSGNSNQFDLIHDGQTYSSADYTVQASGVISGSNFNNGGVAGRRVNNGATNSDMYECIYQIGTGIALFRVINSGNPEGDSGIGTYADASLTSGTSHTLKLSMQGSTIKCFLDGVQRISVTNTTLTAAGDGALVNYDDLPDDYVVTDFNLSQSLTPTPTLTLNFAKFVLLNGKLTF